MAWRSCPRLTCLGVDAGRAGEHTPALEAAVSEGSQKGRGMRRLRSLNRGGRLVVALAVGGAIFAIATAVQADIPDSGGLHFTSARRASGKSPLRAPSVWLIR